MSAANPPIGYGKIWAVLVALVAIGSAFILLPSKELAAVLIFSVAGTKAILVARHYMHIVRQPLMVYVMLGVPLLLAVALALVLIPDIGMHVR